MAYDLATLCARYNDLWLQGGEGNTEARRCLALCMPERWLQVITTCPSAQVSTTKRNPKVNNGFWVMMCQGRSVNSDKYLLHCGVKTLIIEEGENVHVGVGDYGKSPQNCSIKKNHGKAGPLNAPVAKAEQWEGTVRQAWPVLSAQHRLSF